MAEDTDKNKVYVMRPVVKKEADDGEGRGDAVSPVAPAVKEPSQPGGKPPPSRPWQKVQFKQIPTEKIIKTMTNKDMMMQTLHDETMEPHVHLTILLLLVVVLAIIIALLGI